MNKVVTGLILYLVGFAVFHYGLFQQVILQMEEPGLLNRYTYFLMFVAYCIGFNIVLKLKPPIALNGLIVWLLGLYFYKAVLFPPIPWTLLITYMMLWTIGTFLYISTGSGDLRGIQKTHRQNGCWGLQNGADCGVHCSALTGGFWDLQVSRTQLCGAGGVAYGSSGASSHHQGAWQKLHSWKACRILSERTSRITMWMAAPGVQPFR